MQIPKGFSQKLKENRLKETIQLYGRDDFIGGIAVEIVSSSLYEQQIPNIIYEHLEDMKQHQSIDAINKSYHKHTPESKIKFVSLTKQSTILHFNQLNICCNFMCKCCSSCTSLSIKPTSSFATFISISLKSFETI